MSKPKDLVVAITLGNRDLQVVVRTDQGLVRVAPKRVGEFHRALTAGAIRHALWCPQEPGFKGFANDQEPSSLSVEWDSKTNQIAENLGPGGSRASSDDLEGASSNGSVELWLVPGLLWQDLAKLRGELSRGEVELRRVLLFDTRRDAASDRGKKEPQATAPLLKDWLPTYFRSITRDDVDIVLYLTGRDDLHVEDVALNHVFTPSAVCAIDAALLKARGGGAIIRLHDSAGIPALSEPLRSSARFRFRPESVEYRPPPEKKGESLPKVNFTVRPAVDLLESRRRACDLVRAGRFEAAAGLARDFQPKPNDPTSNDVSGEWIRALGAVGEYFRGYVKRSAKAVMGLAESGLRDLLGELVRRDRLCFHVAMRAEAALRADDVISAVLLTATFYEVALRDAINLAVSRDLAQPCVEDRDELVIADSKFTHDELRDFALAQLFDEHGRWCAPQWVKRVAEREVVEWVSDATGTRETVDFDRFFWQEYILLQAIAHFRNMDLSNALHGLRDALRRPEKRTLATGELRRRAPIDDRNLFIHGVPAQDQIVAAAIYFETRGIWLQARQPRPRSFLGSPTKPSAVLAAFGVHDSRGKYEELESGLIAEIENCPLYPTDDVAPVIPTGP